MAMQLTIDKLKYGNTFYNWSTAVRAYLEAEDLWDVVDSGVQDTKDSIQKELRAKYILLCLVDVTIIRNVQTSWSSKKLWDFLNGVGPFLPVSDANKSALNVNKDKTETKDEQKWRSYIAIAFIAALPFIFTVMAAIALNTFKGVSN